MNILEKNLMILASAGSGKTFQLGNRVIGKIALEQVEPERLVALTFTRKAAGEFADSVLTKLAVGSLDEEAATAISEDLGAPVDVQVVLEKFIRSLPKLQLTTLDGFFSRIVRGFQYELGLSGGNFDLLEGERLKNAEAGILEGVLQDGFENRQEFYHAFRKATLGRGQQGVRRSLEDFIETWHEIWKDGARQQAFGNPEVFANLPKTDDWAAQKDTLIAELRDDSQPKAWNTLLDNLANHRVGIKLKSNALGDRFLEVLNEPGPITVKNGRGTLEVHFEIWTQWRHLLQLAIDCEIASAVAKTQAVGELMAQIDHEHSRQLRRRGLLSFYDVKVLLGEWSQSEEARLRRELVDYRLDGRYDHWLLDEFQDTSRAEWRGLEPLLDEAVSDHGGSLFIVGDRKQGIYAWRGGDVSLFDDVRRRYNEGLAVEPMDKSYRSCPAVLDLVNAVCGNQTMIASLFGNSVSEQWEWHHHEAAKSDLTGEAKVTEVPKDDEGQALVDELKRLGIGEKKLTCAVLVRTRAQVEKYAELLRCEKFDVIEAGQRSPGTDHAIGVALTHLIKWLANPSDEFAHEVVAMSPLEAELVKVYDERAGARWDQILQEVQQRGYARFVSSLIQPLWRDLELYGRRRAEDLIAALAEFDTDGEACPRAAYDWIHDLQVNQSPGVAAIQVMTIHKSKGLGFDVVMLPEMPDRTQVPNAADFKIAKGANWLLQVPSKWAYANYGPTGEAFERWQESQLYEALCLLYVALTRAKRGLYIYLPEEPPSRKEKKGWRSPANLVRQSTGIEFTESDPDWTDAVEANISPESKALPVLKPARKLRSRTNPSSQKSSEGSGTGVGRRLGSEVHALFEKIGWLAPGDVPAQPMSQAGKIVEDTLKIPEIHALFEDPGAELFREQAFELIVEEQWMSGVVDRMHIYREDDKVVRVDIIDFKTDGVDSSEELVEQYRGQMDSYRQAISAIFEVESVRCIIVSTHLQTLLTI